MCGQTLVSANDYYFNDLVNYNPEGKRIGFLNNGFSFKYNGPIKNWMAWHLGPSSRWLGLYVDDAGRIGAKFNNEFFTWSDTTVGAGAWHVAQLKYEAGLLEIVLDGRSIHLASVGPLANGDHVFSCNDTGNGFGPMNGCLRNLNVYNDTTIAGIFVDGFESGDTAAWSRSVP